MRRPVGLCALALLALLGDARANAGENPAPADGGGPQGPTQPRIRAATPASSVSNAARQGTAPGIRRDASPRTSPRLAGSQPGPGAVPGRIARTSPTRRPTTARASRAARPVVAGRDENVRRTQASSMDAPVQFGTPIAPVAPVPTAASSDIGAQSLTLQAALYGALTSNPDLIVLRQGGTQTNAPSPEAVEVARRFPTALNPTLWVDYRPITLIPPNTFGNGLAGTRGPHGHNHGGYYHYGQQLLYLSLRQPVELGHQTTHRYHIAQAAYEQQQWNVFQAELTALVQTYRFFQTAAYNREKVRVSNELADFNDRLIEALQNRLKTGQGTAADIMLARVEARAARQQIKAAEQAYRTALTDLRNQIGIPETAGTAEPFGEFSLPPYIPPVDEEVMIREALRNRPDIQAMQAQVRGTHSAVNLAKGDRIPTPVIGPQWEMDEAGIQYIGLVLVSQLPIWNTGKPLVRQREAEHGRAIVAAEQAQQRAISQVRAAVAKWNGATDLVNNASQLTRELTREFNTVQRLFNANQTDLPRLMQARRRLIQLEISRLDAVWAATQAQADLLLALGTPALIHGMLNQAQQTGSPPNPATSTPEPPSPAAPVPNPAPAPPPAPAPAR